jgi:hypothetical protein
MRKLIALAALMVTFVACQQKTEREVGPTATTETTTYSAPQVDTAAAKDAAKDAAHATGTAMETAGQAIQEETKTGTD